MRPTTASRAARQRRTFEERLAAKRTQTVADAKFRARQAHGKLRRFVQIRFRRDEVSASELLSRVTAQVEVRDLSVEEPDIESIVRRIYDRGR